MTVIQIMWQRYEIIGNKGVGNGNYFVMRAFLVGGKGEKPDVDTSGTVANKREKEKGGGGEWVGEVRGEGATTCGACFAWR